MTVEKMLSEYTHIPQTIQKLNRELNDVMQNKKETYNTLQAAIITGMPHGTNISNPTYSAVETLIDRYDERVIAITQEINELINLKETIEKLIRILDVEERRVIELRYFYQYPWNRVQNAVKYSRRNTFLIHQKAIEKMAKEYRNIALNCTFMMVQ